MARERNVYMAKLAEKAERYDEMLEFMQNVSAGSVRSEDPLTGEEFMENESAGSEDPLTVDEFMQNESAGSEDPLTVEERNLFRASKKMMRLAVMKNESARSKVLTVDERNLFYIASKNVINARLASWRIISSLEREELKRGGEDHHLALIRDYRSKMESEMSEMCNRTLELLPRLINYAAEDSRVLYYKMKADYLCYICEFTGGKDYTKAVNRAYNSYKEAEEMAIRELSPIHPIRLGIALNFSTFQSDFHNDRGSACRIAKTTLDEATGIWDRVHEESNKDSTLIMQILTDKLTLWSKSHRL